MTGHVLVTLYLMGAVATLRIIMSADDGLAPRWGRIILFVLLWPMNWLRAAHDILSGSEK